MTATVPKGLSKRIILGVALFAWTLPTLAAEAPAGAAGGSYDWSGPYLGIYGGYAKGHDSVQDLTPYNADGSFGYKVDGPLGGVDGGYNWQCNHIVIGLEGEAGRLGLNDSQQLPRFQGVRLPTDSRASIRGGFFESVAARLGYAFDNILVYTKAGVAGLDAKVSDMDADPTVYPGTGGLTLDSGTSKHAFLQGFTYGGGIEIGLSQHWTLKGEYMIATFDTASHTAIASSADGYTFSQGLKAIQMLKTGLAYKF